MLIVVIKDLLDLKNLGKKVDFRKDLMLIVCQNLAVLQSIVGIPYFMIVATMKKQFFVVLVLAILSQNSVSASPLPQLNIDVDSITVSGSCLYLFSHKSIEGMNAESRIKNNNNKNSKKMNACLELNNIMLLVLFPLLSPPISLYLSLSQN